MDRRSREEPVTQSPAESAKVETYVPGLLDASLHSLQADGAPDRGALAYAIRIAKDRIEHLERLVALAKSAVTNWSEGEPTVDRAKWELFLKEAK